MKQNEQSTTDDKVNGGTRETKEANQFEMTGCLRRECVTVTSDKNAQLMKCELRKGSVNRVGHEKKTERKGSG